MLPLPMEDLKETYSLRLVIPFLIIFLESFLSWDSANLPSE